MNKKTVYNKKNSLMSERRSIRQYNPSVKISREEMSSILQDAMTAPSSFNLQPWRFYVIDSPEGKEKIKPYVMFNEQQWETSSAIIAIYADLENVSNVDEILAADVKYGLKTELHKEKLASAIRAYKEAQSEEKVKNGIMLDCGFVAMQIMLSAKAYGYDTNPIGGYLRNEMTAALSIDAKRYMPVLLISIGKAAEEGKESIRYSVDEITEWV